MQKTHTRSRLVSLVLIIILVVLSGCTTKKKNPTQPSEEIGILAGTVYSTGRNGLAGVLVSVGSKSTTTDSNGKFVLLDVNIGSHVRVNFAKEGYAETQKVVKVEKGKTSYVLAVLRKYIFKNFASTAGVSLNDGSASVVIPEDALVSENGAFLGNVLAKYRYFDPMDVNNVNAFPGGFSGVQTDGSETMFESYGFVYVSLSDAANPNTKLNLAPGKKAQIRAYIPHTLQANAPDIMPMWFYDDQVGKWYEEGFATRQGDYYETEVSHFSYWNFDDPVSLDQQCTITGRVVSAEYKAPVANAQIVATGEDYSGYTSAHSDAQGYFSIPVKASSQVTLRAFSGTSSSGISAPIDTPAANESLDVGTITIADLSFTIVGQLLDTSNNPIIGDYAKLEQLDTPAGEFPFMAWLDVNEDGSFMTQDFYDGALSSFPVQISVWLNHGENVLYSQIISFVVPDVGQVFNFGELIMQTGGQIKGLAKDNEGNIFANETVYFYSEVESAGETHFNAQTDQYGYFILNGPPNQSFARMVGNINIEQGTWESASRTLSFPKSGKTTDIGTVVFSPLRK